MNLRSTPRLLAKDPIEALAQNPRDAVLAIITNVEGPSYRPLGAVMAILADGTRIGSLSSGCIEDDLGLHAQQVLAQGQPRTVRYGRGSPYIDIQLPCGGGLEILLVPRPDVGVMRALRATTVARKSCVLEIAPETGKMAIAEAGSTGEKAGVFRRRFEPDLRFLVFGKGPEAWTFAGLVQSAGYPNVLLSPDAETLALGGQSGNDTCHLTSARFPEDLPVDDRTAIVLFFHDHDWEPPILAHAVTTPAFYIGAQGSQRARDTRLSELRALGVAASDLDRLHGPVGLIPSARDAGTLAVSVLAEILAVAMAATSSETG